MTIKCDFEETREELETANSPRQKPRADLSDAKTKDFLIRVRLVSGLGYCKARTTWLRSCMMAIRSQEGSELVRNVFVQPRLRP
jgi:hypothetical protein